MRRHRAAVEAGLKRSSGSPVVESALRGLADRWDQIEELGVDGSEVPVLARAMLRAFEHLRSHSDEALSQLEADLRES